MHCKNKSEGKSGFVAFGLVQKVVSHTHTIMNELISNARNLLKNIYIEIKSILDIVDLRNVLSHVIEEQEAGVSSSHRWVHSIAHYSMH